MSTQRDPQLSIPREIKSDVTNDLRAAGFSSEETFISRDKNVVILHQNSKGEILLTLHNDQGETVFRPEYSSVLDWGSIKHKPDTASAFDMLHYAAENGIKPTFVDDGESLQVRAIFPVRS